MVKSQTEYDRKLDDVSSAKVFKMAEEQKVRKYNPSELILAPTDTQYDAPLQPEARPTLKDSGEKAKQNVQLSATGAATEEDEKEEEVDTSQRDKNIMTAIAIVVAISFVSGGEKSVSENTFSTILAMALFFGGVKLLAR